MADSRTADRVPYAAIGRHGVIGDRRTAALVAADGNLDWLCLPDYDGDVTFGALLDFDAGGYWRFGPADLRLGTQDYREDTATLVTTWQADGYRLELSDAMTGPERDRGPGREDDRVVVRHLRCVRGRARCALAFAPHWDFATAKLEAAQPQELVFRAGPHKLRLWISRPLPDGSAGSATFELSEGEELWAVLRTDDRPEGWSVTRSREALDATERYWRDWVSRLSYNGPRRREVLRSALLVHLLSYAPTGSHVAAPTTSLPERIGGDWQADYRYAWVRDTSLSLGILEVVGDSASGERYLEWLAKLESSTAAPLQVVYGVRGQTALPQRERKDLYGYRGSSPVRFGNHAYRQCQHDTLGFFLDSAWTHLELGGRWRPEFGELVRRAADYVAGHWREPGSSIWELPVEQHYLSAKVMSWVALDRAVRIADRLGGNRDRAAHWRAERDAVFADVLARGWSDRLGAFRQRYEGDNLDAAALLIPVMGLLPPDDPRVAATVERVAGGLAVDGFVHRFVPAETPGVGKLPLGEYEGAFLPCTFWLATANAMMGRVTEAEAILQRAERIAGPLGLFAEGVDTRTDIFLGNGPLLFSHAEYVRAVTHIARSGGASGVAG
jgi:GH15 family glucan-1,4-alpha-glucosidase